MKHLPSRLALLTVWVVLNPVHPPDPLDPAAGSLPWFKRSLVGLEVGPTGSQFGASPADTGFATRFNGRDIARATKDCGAGIHEIIQCRY